MPESQSPADTNKSYEIESRKIYESERLTFWPSLYRLYQKSSNI